MTAAETMTAAEPTLPPSARAVPTPDPAPAASAQAARKRRSSRAVFRRRRGVLRGLTLVIATTLSLFGTVGQFYFVDKIEETIAARAEEMRAIETRTETLRTAQSSYFNAQVQGNMLFALNPADRSVNKGIVGNLYSLALYDRAFPFRSILGELAIAGAIDFKTVNDQYNALREAAMTDFAYEPFIAVGAFEHEIIDQAMKLHGALQERYWKAAEEKAKAETQAARRRASLLAVAAAATCLFLLASLIGAKD